MIHDLRPLGDDLHRVPLVLLEMRLHLLRIRGLLHRLRPIGGERGDLTGGGHQVAGFLLRMLLGQQGVMPQSHLVLLGDFGLVTKDLETAQVVAPHLHAGIALVPAKLQSQDEIRRLFLPPDQPVLPLRFARAPDLAIAHFPHPGLNVPAFEILAIEDRGEARVGSGQRETEEKREEEDVFHCGFNPSFSKTSGGGPFHSSIGTLPR